MATRATTAKSAPKKFTSWSFSRYMDYKGCPAKAKYKHLDKLQEPPNDAMARHSITSQSQMFLQQFTHNRRLSDYLIVCDESNNTPSVVDSNSVRADVHVKPAKSIERFTIRAKFCGI